MARNFIINSGQIRNRKDGYLQIFWCLATRWRIGILWYPEFLIVQPTYPRFFEGENRCRYVSRQLYHPEIRAPSKLMPYPAWKGQLQTIIPKQSSGEEMVPMAIWKIKGQIWSDLVLGNNTPPCWGVPSFFFCSHMITTSWPGTCLPSGPLGFPSSRQCCARALWQGC